jgi:beta-N-acetylhexosaminidase
MPRTEVCKLHTNPRYVKSSIGQLLLTGVPGFELTPEFARACKMLQPGGFILFGRNIQSPIQLRKLIDDLRDLSASEPIITIDQEGGRVSRLKLLGNEPPNAEQIRLTREPAFAERHGAITAALLRIFGFNLDLCPVLDICFDPDADNSLRGRCYGTDAASTIEFASAFQRGLRSGGILSCGKHFPGYSRAAVDPHHHLPVVDLSRDELEVNELAVFRHFCAAGEDAVDSMMIGHAFYPALDPDRVPTSLSPRIVDQLLRVEMMFRGLIMTDDLDMGAILEERDFDDTILQALAAGNDLLMICHRIEMVERAAKMLEMAPRAQLDRALENVQAFKSRLAPPAQFSESAFLSADADVWRLRVDVLGEEGAAERSVDDGKRSPVELY